MEPSQRLPQFLFYGLSCEPFFLLFLQPRRVNGLDVTSQKQRGIMPFPHGLPRPREPQEVEEGRRPIQFAFKVRLELRC